MGPYQPKLAEYLSTESARQYHQFQYSWFDQFPWLEHSPSKDVVFCFPYFIFENKMPRHPTFTTEDFKSWKRVNDGVRCELLMHVGSPTSPYNNVVKSAEDLIKVNRHIDKVLNAKTVEEVQKNRLQLRTTIESVRWLSLQTCAFRGHDESSISNNRGNFVEMIRLIGRLNVDIDDVVLEKSSEICKVYLTDYSKRDFAYSRE